MLGQRVACGILIGLISLCASCRAETDSDTNQEDKSVTIPLDQIWALNMPRTHKLTLERRGPQSEFVSDEGPTVEEIYISLQAMDYDQQLSPAFAVLGTGIEALNHANDVLAGRQKRRAFFTTNDEVSLVFFARGRHEHVHIRKAERLLGQTRIQYQLVPYLIGPQTTIHFAMIPLGRLPLGKMKVEMIRLSIDKQPNSSAYKPPSLEAESQIVSPPFQFTVTKSASD